MSHSNRLQFKRRLVMNRNEFIEELRTALTGEVPNSEVESNITYYTEYIQQRSKENGEAAVLEELGEPRLIARTIIDTYRLQKGIDHTKYYDDVYSEKNNTDDSNNNSHYTRFNIIQPKWYHKIAVIGVVIAAIAILILISSAIIRLLFTIGIPLLVIYIIIKSFQRR